MVDFIFGGNTGITTPEELASRRELVRAIKARNAGAVSQDPWEGLNALADAVGGRIEESRIKDAEIAGRRRADEKFERYIQGGLGSPPPADVISDPWMSENQREFLKLYYPQQKKKAP